MDLPRGGTWIESPLKRTSLSCARLLQRACCYQFPCRHLPFQQITDMPDNSIGELIAHNSRTWYALVWRDLELAVALELTVRLKTSDSKNLLVRRKSGWLASCAGLDYSMWWSIPSLHHPKRSRCFLASMTGAWPFLFPLPLLCGPTALTPFNARTLTGSASAGPGDVSLMASLMVCRERQ